MRTIDYENSFHLFILSLPFGDIIPQQIFSMATPGPRYSTAGKIPCILPNPALITEPAKNTDMVSISFQAFVGRMISGAGERVNLIISGMKAKNYSD